MRGWDSTGIIRLGDKGEVDTVKAAMNAGEFLDQSNVKMLLNKRDTVGYIGHNRYATIGQVNSVNAHPFTYDKITLVHNGTLDTVYDLDDPHGGGDTDSEQIAYTMSCKGESETLTLIDGAYVLAWVNGEDGSLNLARNYERTLYYAFDTAGTSLFFASEQKMLSWLLDRNKIYHKEIVALKADTHHKLKVSEHLGKACLKVAEYPIVKKHRYCQSGNYHSSHFSKHSNASCSKEIEFNYLGIEPYHGSSEYGKMYGVHYDEDGRATQITASPVKVDECEHLEPWELIKGMVSYTAKYIEHDDYGHYITNIFTQTIMNQDTLVASYPNQSICDNCYRYEEIAYEDGENKLCLNCIDIGKDLIAGVQ